MIAAYRRGVNPSATDALSAVSGVVAYLFQNPTLLWVAALIIAAMLGIRAARRATPVRTDERRMFTGYQKAEAKRRAGGQCEHSTFGIRCGHPGEHADHIYPHSKGGATQMSNCQSLCAKHNLQKSNHIPSRWYIYRLERRRRRYFPAGEPVQVEWRIGPAR